MLRVLSGGGKAGGAFAAPGGRGSRVAPEYWCSAYGCRTGETGNDSGAGPAGAFQHRNRVAGRMGHAAGPRYRRSACAGGHVAGGVALAGGPTRIGEGGGWRGNDLAGRPPPERGTYLG